MDIGSLKDVLTKAGRRELGIPVVLPSLADKVFQVAQWSLEGDPIEGRQVWFCVGNAKEIQAQLPAELRNRIIPIAPDCLDLVFKRGPYDALLLPTHGFWYSDPNLLLSAFWKARGSYVQQDCSFQEWNLWFWKSNRNPLKLFGMDHHHAVLWDAMQIARPLGVQIDFHWLSDGRPPVNEPLPTQLPGFKSSLDLYQPPLELPLSDAFRVLVNQKSYDGIISSHSIVSCARLAPLGLPMIHVNSTRFGNSWVQDPSRHAALVSKIQTLIQEDRLSIVHNNKGDASYFYQYFPTLSPHQELVIPSLCESLVRLRKSAPHVPKLLLWDTRQVLIQQNKSPFMKELYVKCKEAWGDAVESQALLLAEKKSYLPEGYLDAYTAVIHIPYNISTMSMFQQVRSNIPIWVPSKRLLAELWTNPAEPNELSWTVFVPGSEGGASAMDKVRDPLVVQRWLDTADFYNPDVLPLVFEFDSIEDLVAKGLSTDYQAAMDAAESKQQQRREELYFAWEQVLRGSLKENGTRKN
jgi:hypothetical protein